MPEYKNAMAKRYAALIVPVGTTCAPRHGLPTRIALNRLAAVSIRYGPLPISPRVNVVPSSETDAF